MGSDRAVGLSGELKAYTRCARLPAIHQVLLRFLMLVMLALAGMVLFAGVTSFKGRWMLPLLCVAPLAAFAAPRLQQDPRGGRYSVAIFGIAVIPVAAACAPLVPAAARPSG